ncbi:MAG: hypothetical protein WAS21_27975 [Geminicoccaceae bacterium]
MAEDALVRAEDWVAGVHYERLGEPQPPEEHQGRLDPSRPHRMRRPPPGDEEVRLECLKIAARGRLSGKGLLVEAERLFDYVVRNGWIK